MLRFPNWIVDILQKILVVIVNFSKKKNSFFFPQMPSLKICWGFNRLANLLHWILVDFNSTIELSIANVDRDTTRLSFVCFFLNFTRFSSFPTEFSGRWGHRPGRPFVIGRSVGRRRGDGRLSRSLRVRVRVGRNRSAAFSGSGGARISRRSVES